MNPAGQAALGSSHFGLQEPILFDLSVLDNIAFGCEFASEKEKRERVEEAAK